ncbi:MAG: hypothetical protein IJN17_01810 [Clostridia bacterium]|nr:hypothetical protein [Clostridia bacterium]
MNRLFIILTAILVLLTCLSACGSDNDTENAQTSAPETQDETVNGEATEDATETQEETQEETQADPIYTKRPDWPDESKYSFFKVFEAPDVAPRDAVLNYMREMATVEWTPTVQWTTLHKDPAENSRLNVNHTYEVGKKYYGIPYANTGSSLDGFLSVLEDGKFTPNSPYYTELIGNHCSSSMDRAFEQIVDINGYGGILPEWNSEQLMYPVGSGIEAPEGWTHDTRLIAEHSGKDKMFAGYAALDKGDILYYTAPSGGHTRMVSGVNIVKNVTGLVNYDKSTVSVIEQTNAWYTEEKNTTWFVDKKYTFRTLYEKAFIPVTLKVYHDEDFVIPDAYIALEGEITPEMIKKNYIPGTISSNFTFSHIRATVRDQSGNIVLQDAVYQNFNKKSYVLRQLYLDVKSLPAGNYTFTLHAGIARGGCDVCSFEFTVE